MLFSSKSFEKEITVEGMHCGHCAKRVEEGLAKIKGVKKVTVDLESKKVKILSKVELDNQVILTTVENLGYVAKI